MNIVFLNSTFAPTTGGAESYALMLCTRPSEAGHRLRVVTDMPGSGDYSAFEERNENLTVHWGKLVHRCDSQPRLSGWEQLTFAVHIDAAQAIGSASFDLVHANGFETTILGSCLALSLGVPLVCTFHERWPEREALGEGRCRLIHGYLPIAAIVAASEFYFRRARRFKSEQVRLELIHHGIDTDLFRPAPSSFAEQRYGLPPGTRLIVCSGRRAFAQVRASVPEARLLWRSWRPRRGSSSRKQRASE